jgi:hypothetical protein
MFTQSTIGRSVFLAAGVGLLAVVVPGQGLCCDVQNMATHARSALEKYQADAQRVIFGRESEAVARDPLHYAMGFGPTSELVAELRSSLGRPEGLHEKSESHPGQWLLAATRILGPGGRNSAASLSVSQVVLRERQDSRYGDLAEWLLSELPNRLSGADADHSTIQRAASRADLSWYIEAVSRDAAWRGAEFAAPWPDASGRIVSIPWLIRSQISVYELEPEVDRSLSTGGGAHLAWLLGIVLQLFDDDPTFQRYAPDYRTLLDTIVDRWAVAPRRTVWRYADGLRDAHFVSLLLSPEISMPSEWDACGRGLSAVLDARRRAMVAAVAVLVSWISEPRVSGWTLKMHAIHALELVARVKCKET